MLASFGMILKIKNYLAYTLFLQKMLIIITQMLLVQEQKTVNRFTMLYGKRALKNKDSRFQAKYTDVPRGCVFEVEDQGFIVCVGKWINDYPEAKAEILYEFQLPNDTEFVIDSHWDLGYGWSDKKF